MSVTSSTQRGTIKEIENYLIELWNQTLMNEVLVALSGIWLMLPALVPNSTAVIFGGGKPIDLGRTWRGRRILGDGKTFNGFIGGVISGVALGLIQLLIAYSFDSQTFWGFGSCPQCIGVIIILAVGALLGDMGGSFIKRRLGMERGTKTPGLDQFDFLIGAVILSVIFYPEWFYDSFISGENIIALVCLLIAVPLLHRVVNVIGYKMGKKDVPW